jgi:prepilin peptidase CpaA
MEYFVQHYGPTIAIMSVLMTIGAVIDGWKRKVPNWITYPTIILGWLWWTGVAIKTGDWSLPGVSLLATFAAGLPLLVLWRIGFMGAGDVKLYAGFGAWMVPVPGFGFENLWWAFAYSVLLGGVMGLVDILRHGTPMVNVENAKESIASLTNSASLDEIRAKALERKKRQALLPYGVPLTIGSLAYVALLFSRWGVAGM